MAWLEFRGPKKKKRKKGFGRGRTKRSVFPSVEQTKAAFYFPSDASWLYSLREELLNLKGNPIPFCLSAPNQPVAVCPCECGPVETDTSIRWNLEQPVKHPHGVHIWL